jgi:hypothetical protein
VTVFSGYDVDNATPHVDMNCPTDPGLLMIALGEGESSGFRGHVEECDRCQRELTRLLDVIAVLRSTARADAAVPGVCLDEVDLAGLVDAPDPATQRDSIAHLAGCEACRTRLAAVVQLLVDGAVAAEVARLEQPTSPRRLRLLPAGALAGAAAAALAAVMLWPEAGRMPVSESARDVDALRERTVTATVAPRIIAPDPTAGAEDSMRWTSVPRADLYRITVWDRGGTVVWEGQTRDTVLALPATLPRGDGETYLWVVDARTGWDRWVSSELHEFTIRTDRGGAR